MSDSLGNKSRKGLAWDLVGVFFRQVGILVVTVILARLLTPEEFGIVGMAMVFVSITQVFITVGFTDGIIQKKGISNLELSSVFYVNFTISAVLAAVIYLSATAIGNFYDEPEVTAVLQYLAVIPVFAGLGRVHSAILTKRMDFKALTVRDIIATILGGIVGVVAAFQGQGVYALVWQQIVVAVAGTILLWIGSGWLPQWRFSFEKIRSLLSFSAYVFFDQVLRQVFAKIDTLFIGKVFSAATLGFYSRAESLNAQVSNYTSTSLRKIIFPALSSIQDDDERFEKIYFKVLKMAVFVSVISAAVLFFLAQEIILLLLGDQWQASVILFQIMVFRLLSAPLGPLMGKAMLAKGYSKEKFRISQLQRLIMLTPLPIGYYYGVEAFTITLVVAKFAGVLINMVLMEHLFGFKFRNQLVILVKPNLPFVALILVYVIMPFSIPGLVKAVLFLPVYLAYSYLLKDEGAYLIYQEIRRMIGLIKQRLRPINS
ncbi:MAG: lipopolysaccharide biosynthesis protein [Bacteroidota bacterium]